MPETNAQESNIWALQKLTSKHFYNDFSWYKLENVDNDTVLKNGYLTA